MLNLFFPLVVFAFLVGYLFFSLYKTNKSKRLLCEMQGYNELNRQVQFNFYFSLFLLGAAFVIAFVFTFFPKLYASVSFQMMDNAFVNNAGMVMIKNSFVILVVTGFQASVIMGSDNFTDSLRLSYKIEALMFFTILLLSTGVFLFVSNIGSLVIFIFSAGLFIRSILVYRKY